ncbi:MAG: hypothetical protein P8176_10320 [Gammaproteobacteria bacterium]
MNKIILTVLGSVVLSGSINANVMASLNSSDFSGQRVTLNSNLSKTETINVNVEALNQINNASLSLSDVSVLIPPRIRLFPQTGFVEGSICVAPAAIAEPDIDIHRTLFVHDAETVGSGHFSLRQTLQKISDDVSSQVPGASPESIFKQFWDTQNDQINAETLGNPHCDDHNGLVNGFPLNTCKRAEGTEAIGTAAEIAAVIDNEYQPLALINRIDLADSGWKNCGEHRIIYGKANGIEKNLIIFEGVLPNPKPGCRSGCRDVIEFWLDLSDDSDPSSRAVKLAQFYYEGLPGFSEVVHVNHYASSALAQYGNSTSGQIRTNQFLSDLSSFSPDPWTLKEFKTFLSCRSGVCDFDIMPTSVKANPYGQLWKRDLATGSAPTLPGGNPYAIGIPNIMARAANFQQDVVNQVTADRLANPSINGFTYQVDSNKNGAESQSLSPTFDHYRNQAISSVDPGFINDLNAAGAPFTLNANHIVNRATALSCAGCHQPGAFGLTANNALGHGLRWPNSLGFVHVEPTVGTLAGEPEFDPTHFAGNSAGFAISDALLDVFLPHRETVLVDLANQNICNCAPNVSVLPLPVLRQRELIKLLREIEIKFDDPVIDPVIGPVVDAVNQLEPILQNNTLSASTTFSSSALLSRLLSSKSLPVVYTPDIRINDDAERDRIQRVEQEQAKLIEEAGISMPTVNQDAMAVTLDKVMTTEQSTETVKRAAFEALVDKEIPRETFTGSFRTH